MLRGNKGTGFGGRVFRRLCNSPRSFRSLLFWCIGSGLCLALFATYKYRDHELPEGIPIVDLSKNYFQRVGELLAGDFLVNNEQCRIPHVDIWNSGIRLLLSPSVSRQSCNWHGNLTYVANNSIVINEEAVQKRGFTLDQVTCCYNTIHRVSQNASSFDTEADNLFRYSDECFEMKVTTKPNSGFVKVTCTSANKGWLHSWMTWLLSRRLSYVHFHAIAMFPNKPVSGESNDTISQKLEFWNKCAARNTSGSKDNGKIACARASSGRRPPNVLVIGIDSTSRMNFHRFLHRTVKVLEDTIEAADMKGNTKVGENTFPNFVPMMTSLSEGELVGVCYPDRWKPQDGCPYIWKSFAEHNYLTAHLEDSPKMAIFNYMKTGFINQPVDIYMRPFMVAAYKNSGGYPYRVDCIGCQSPEEIILNYVADMTLLSELHKIPYFITTWLSDLTHENMNDLQVMDDVLAHTLQKMHYNGLLDNTVLFVMSDHGYRYTEVRATLSGWYEDKLPALWIKLPPTVASENPTWLDALNYNSRQLVSPFDVHETFQDILKAYLSPSTSSEDNTMRNGSDSHPLRGLSLFQKLPIRTCEQVGVPRSYCACDPPVEYNENATFIRMAGEAVVRSMNSWIPSPCSRLKLAFVTASGGFFSSGQSTNESSNAVQLPEMLIVGLTTVPGYFRFEAWVTYDHMAGKFTTVSNILRTSKVNTSTSCLGPNDVFSEVYCYCPPIL